jgi:hypothetical protein
MLLEESPHVLFEAARALAGHDAPVCFTSDGLQFLVPLRRALRVRVATAFEEL